MKYSRYLAAALCSLFALTTAYSQNPQRTNFGPRHARMVESLKLSDSQKKDFENLNTDFAKQRVEQQAKIKVAGIELHSLLQADAPDRSAIQKKVGEISDLQAQNRMLRVDHWFAINKILTPDQQKIWKDVLERPMGGCFGGRMGQRMGGGMMMQHNGPMMQHNGGMMQHGDSMPGGWNNQ